MSDRLRRFPTTFGGHVSFQMWCDYLLWEEILNDTYGVEAIVEFGTAYGGFSLYLLVQARMRGLEFYTFDKHDPDEVALEDLWDLPQERFKLSPHVRRHMRVVDLLVDPDKLPMEVLETFIDRRAVIFMDNGNKRQEVKLYAPYIFPGSLMVVHDWMEEIFPADIPADFIELYGDLCNEIGSKSRVFRKQ